MSTNLENVKKALKAFHEQLDMSVATSYWADSYRAQIFPESLGLKEWNKDEHLASATKMLGNIKEYTKFELVELFENANKVTGHLRATAILKDGTEYMNEGIIILTFNDEGKVVYFKQFNDSLAFSQMAGKLMA
ncbi:hypothetical protein DL96DRAFT_1556582 [Flagelloscypha sp. PMI_526]|nr:hypothetical protein DL96DRAFT_1556582 [Flagelloscypha sp. PMI_526]